ncbi:MAG: UDP-N-acetylmuramoylalanine--D-glutamate ligase [Acidobacteria bacterium RIFCSPLOWO2_12_FULL_67_14b]|nr:MAG: UDP-N-acetylmuramoylalanine--D-glutamate ligase [Acidobacteria bacterium RIFCSPLOWO2_12_FULL_67_14b]
MTARDFSVSGQTVLVVGAARSGVAAARLLARRGAVTTLTDRKPQIPEAADLRAAGVRLELGGHVMASFAGASLIVMSPGVPPDLPEVARARAAGVPVIGELELASRWLRGPIVAITGTKGKSTTTTLVGRMLEASGRRVLVGGNIGYPLSAQVEASTDDTVHVVEASSFQLEATQTFRPWIAALLNVSADHLDRHPDLAAYAAAKARIFANQQPRDWAVINADSAEATRLAEHVPAQVVRYAVENTAPAEVYAGRGFVWHRTSEGDVPLLPLAAVQLAGRHMLSNVVAATAISHLAGATGDSLARALDGFTGLEHVMEPAGARGGVRFVNDSKATNIDAAARSIESFDKVVAIVGGKFKGGDFADLAGPLREHGRAVVAIGEARPLVRRALAGVVPVVEAETLAAAVRRAWDLAVPDGVVLLAPACASFDMFVDYADRGRRFKEEVQRLITEA